MVTPWSPGHCCRTVSGDRYLLRLGFGFCTSTIATLAPLLTVLPARGMVLLTISGLSFWPLRALGFVTLPTAQLALLISLIAALSDFPATLGTLHVGAEAVGSGVVIVVVAVAAVGTPH